MSPRGGAERRASERRAGGTAQAVGCPLTPERRGEDGQAGPAHGGYPPPTGGRTPAWTRRAGAERCVCILLPQPLASAGTPGTDPQLRFLGFVPPRSALQAGQAQRPKWLLSPPGCRAEQGALSPAAAADPHIRGARGSRVSMTTTSGAPGRGRVGAHARPRRTRRVFPCRPRCQSRVPEPR